MTQHSSLRSKEKGKAHRSVLKRHERVKELKEKEKWEEGKSVFGLPKQKIVKLKIKKEKAVPAAEGAVAADGAAVTTQTAPEAKGAAKEAAPKKEEKKK
ncbi:MAG: small basic protein [Candidatus Omnitrophota bacterium]